MKQDLRKDALTWWRSLSETDKDVVIDEFRKSGAWRSNWPKELIETSSSTIEAVFINANKKPSSKGESFA